MTQEAIRTIDGGGAASEQIDVVRIKLLRAGRSAVVSELRTADLLLARWAETDTSERALSFEVTFVDGCAFCGRYVYETGKRLRPSLSRFVRRIFNGLEQAPFALPDGTRFLKAPTADLALYAINGN